MDAIQAWLELIGEDQIPVRAFRVEEALDELLQVTALLRLPFERLTDALLDKQARLIVEDERDGSRRQFATIVIGFAMLAEVDGEALTELELSSPEQIFLDRVGYRMFVEETTLQVLDHLFADAGLRTHLAPRARQRYAVRPQCVMHEESEWHLLVRLLADEGATVWFDTTDGKPHCHVGDALDSFEAVSGDSSLPFRDAAVAAHSRSLTAFRAHRRVAPDCVHLMEDNIRSPDQPFEAKAGTGEGEVFIYPARVEDTTQIEARAKVRLEQVRRASLAARAESNILRLQAGRWFEVDTDALGDVPTRWLVERVVHEFLAPEADGTGGSYANWTELSSGLANRRPELPHWQTIPGLEVATTTGPVGEEIHVDDLGSVKLKFPWDRSDINDGRSSYWARTLQLMTGGSMMLPRVGWEVPVVFRNGDPDRPLVLGRLYNAGTALPYSLPGAAATTSLQSATTPGGGSTNEVRMADGKGREQFFVNASHDLDIAVGGSLTTTIAGNEKQDVGLSLELTAASQGLTVGGSQSVTVGTEHTVAIGGSRSLTIGGVELVKVNASRTVGTGSYSELVGGLHGVQCNQHNTKAGGAMLEVVGGSAAVLAGAGVSESVLGARIHLVSGPFATSCTSYSESVVGAKSIRAGASRIKSGGPVSTSASSTNITSGSLKVKAGGPVTLKAGTISIVVGGSVKTPGGTIGGGTVKVKGGKLSGEVKRSGGTKVDG